MGKRTVLARKKRHYRIRNKVRGTGGVPRMSVYRSLRHIYAQLIDDMSGRCIISCSTLSGRYREYAGGEKRTKKEAAKTVGQIIAEEAKKKGIARAVFDRGGYKFHGRVRSLAEGAKKAGLRL